MKGLEIRNISEKSRQGSYGIVYTSWNADVVQDLLNEAKKELLNQGVDEKNIAILHLLQLHCDSLQTPSLSHEVSYQKYSKQFYWVA